MEVFVAIVCLSLVIGRAANWSNGAVDKTPNVSQWGPALVDNLAVVFKVRGRKEVVRVETKEVVPALIEEYDDFVEDFGDG